MGKLDRLDDDELYMRFRFTKQGIYLLAGELNYLESKTKRNHAFPATTKILCTLHYFACGSFQHSELVPLHHSHNNIFELISTGSSKGCTSELQFCLRHANFGKLSLKVAN